MIYTEKSYLFLTLCTLLCSGCDNQITIHKKNYNYSQIKQDNINPVIILGSGISGLVAGIYLSQANIPVLIIEGEKPGGALTKAHSVRNWPGVIDSPGLEITGKIFDQAKQLNINTVQEKVISVDFTQYPFIISTQVLDETKKIIDRLALTCIITMGTEPNLLNITGEKEYFGRGVSTCAVCEGSLYKNKKVIIVGGGDAAITEAGYLSDIVSQVTLVVRKEKFRAKNIQEQERVCKKLNVKVLFNTELKEIKGDNTKVTQVILENNKIKKTETLDIDGVFLAIGARPNTDIFKKQLECNENNFIITKNYQASSVPGVYAAGDITDSIFRQAITAAGDGCKAALQAKKFLEEIGYQTQQNITSSPVSTGPKDINITEIKSQKDFDIFVLDSAKGTIIDVYATMCLGCQKVAKVIEDIIPKFKDKINFVKINIDNKECQISYVTSKINGKDIQSVPTVIFIKNKKEIFRIEKDAYTKDQLEKDIQKFLL
jgi:thioredoxin reductase (NADPH)